MVLIREMKVMTGVCLFAVLTWDLVQSRQFPTRLKVKRVKAAQPFLIDWAQFGSFGRDGKSLALSYLPPTEEEVQVQEDSKPQPVQPTPIVDLDITPIFDIPEVDVPELSVDPVITPIFADPVTDTPVLITELVDTESSCKIVRETIEEEVEENQCKVVTSNSCVNTTTPTDCYTTVEKDCKDENMTETQTVCKENIVNVCNDEIEDLTKNRCGFVSEQKCEAGYLTELKDECQYETVLETVCSTGYLVEYQEECNEVDSKQSCKKIPKYPTKQCRKVPRIEGKCKKVPVRRPNNNCSPVKRVVCQEIPYKQLIKKCVYTNRPICSQEPVEVVRNICNTVEKEICTIAVTEGECQPVTENICQTVLVPKTKIVEREICEPEENTPSLNNLERSNFNKEDYRTTF